MERTGIFCARCEKEMKEAETTDDLQGNLRTYCKCPCGNTVYVITATTGDDEKEDAKHSDTPGPQKQGKLDHGGEKQTIEG